MGKAYCTQHAGFRMTCLVVLRLQITESYNSEAGTLKPELSVTLAAIQIARAAAILAVRIKEQWSDLNTAVL
jgi:hypothetical protein